MPATEHTTHKTTPELWPQVVVEEHPASLFLKDVGGKKSHLTLRLALKGKRIPAGASLRLTALLHYEFKNPVEADWQHVLRMMPEGRSKVWVLSGSDAEALIKFRIERVSSNFQGRKFRLGVIIERVSASGTATACDTVFSEAIEVRAKRCQKGLKAQRRRRKLANALLDDTRPRKRACTGLTLDDISGHVLQEFTRMAEQQRKQREALAHILMAMRHQIETQEKRFQELKRGVKRVTSQALRSANLAQCIEQQARAQGVGVWVPAAEQQHDAGRLLPPPRRGADDSSVYHVRHLEEHMAAPRRPVSRTLPLAIADWDPDDCFFGQDFELSCPSDDLLQGALGLLSEDRNPQTSTPAGGEWLAAGAPGRGRGRAEV